MLPGDFWPLLARRAVNVLRDPNEPIYHADPITDILQTLIVYIEDDQLN